MKKSLVHFTARPILMSHGSIVFQVFVLDIERRFSERNLDYIKSHILVMFHPPWNGMMLLHWVKIATGPYRIQKIPIKWLNFYSLYDYPWESMGLYRRTLNF